MTQQTTLDARYGRTPRDRRRNRWMLIAVIATLAALIVAWLIWVGPSNAKPQIDATDVGHTVVDDTRVEVTWRLSVQPGTATRCAVQALNPSFGVVGWKTIMVPPSSEYTRVFTDTVLTSELATTGLIYRCWLA